MYHPCYLKLAKGTNHTSRYIIISYQLSQTAFTNKFHKVGQ